MYTKELLAFVTVAGEGSFLKAAKKLYLTPASVMNQINKLEQQAGVKLLVRTNQGTQLTEAGRVIYKAGTEIIRKTNRAYEKARQTAGAEQTAIKIGTSLLRPAKLLLDLWQRADNNAGFGIKIIPFDDEPQSMAAMLELLGTKIDCFAGPCDSLAWAKKYNICPLGMARCCLAVPRGHRLAQKELLAWDDLNGETMVLVKPGESPVVDRLRAEITSRHPGINISDANGFYDIEVFNSCWQNGYIMEVPELWADVHPSLVTKPVAWDYEMPYGIIYSKNPAPAVKRFVAVVEAFVKESGGGAGNAAKN